MKKSQCHGVLSIKSDFEYTVRPAASQPGSGCEHAAQSFVLLIERMAIKHLQISIGPRREKTCLRGFANNTGTDQPAHLRSLIRAFVIQFLESIISRLATSDI